MKGCRRGEWGEREIAENREHTILQICPLQTISARHRCKMLLYQSKKYFCFATCTSHCSAVCTVKHGCKINGTVADHGQAAKIALPLQLPQDCWLHLSCGWLPHPAYLLPLYTFPPFRPNMAEGQLQHRNIWVIYIERIPKWPFMRFTSKN